MILDIEYCGELFLVEGIYYNGDGWPGYEWDFQLEEVRRPDGQAVSPYARKALELLARKELGLP